MPPKGRRASLAGSAVCGAAEFQPLTKEEIKFVWHGLVEETKLTPPKLQKFMKEVCGTRLSRVQAKDLLSYMDADGNGHVGFADFEYFMSIGRLRDTDPKNFMWTPKARWRREHPEQNKDKDSEDMGADGGSKVAYLDAGKDVPEGAAAEGAPPAPAASSRGVDDATRSRIDAALDKYEKEMWQKFLKQEEDLQRQLFNQFATTGSDELQAMEFHRMLQRWYPLAHSWAPGDLRAGDSLATLEYLLRRERELNDKEKSSMPGASREGRDSKADAAVDGSREEAKLTYSMWLDVISGKYRPDEHLVDDKKK